MPILNAVKRHPRVQFVKLCHNDDEYVDYMMSSIYPYSPNPPDLVMYCGWSSEPRKDMLALVPHVGLHCAESDVYSAGTPLQNQIIDGLKETKHRVFKVGHPELSLRLWSHETTIDLRGGISDVFEQLTSTGKLLYNRFLDDWPDVTWQEWPAHDEKEWRPKRRPADSRLNIHNVKDMSTAELYDFFRCLEAPYPNGCIEDSVGRLYVERVRFEKK